MATIAAFKPLQTVSALDGYDPGDFYCELLGADKQPNRQIAPLWHCLETSELSTLKQRAIKRFGIELRRSPRRSQNIPRRNLDVLHVSPNKPDFTY